MDMRIVNPNNGAHSEGSEGLMSKSCRDCHKWFSIICSFLTNTNFMSHVARISGYARKTKDISEQSPPL